MIKHQIKTKEVQINTVLEIKYFPIIKKEKLPKIQVTVQF